MKKYVFLLLPLIWGCGNDRKTENAATAIEDSTAITNEDAYSTRYVDLASYLTEQEPAGAKVQSIDYKCAIIVTPNTTQMDEMSKEYGDDLESVVDDGFYYQGLALHLLDSFNIKHIDAQENSYLKLVGANNSYTLDVRRKGLPEWNIIFFSPAKKPEVISAIELTPEKTQEYFSR